MNAPKIELGRVELFRDVAASTLDELEQKVVFSEFAKGDTLLEQGSIGEELFLILSGTVQVILDAGTPREKEIARLHSGDFFGEMSLIEKLPRCATIRALEPVVIGALSRKALDDVQREHPRQYHTFMLNVARALSRRLRVLDEKIAQLPEFAN